MPAQTPDPPTADDLVDVLRSIAESYPATEEGETLAAMARDVLRRWDAAQ